MHRLTVPEIHEGDSITVHSRIGGICISSLFGLPCDYTHVVESATTDYAIRSGFRTISGACVDIGENREGERVYRIVTAPVAESYEEWRRFRSIYVERIWPRCAYCGDRVPRGNTTKTADGNEGCVSCIQECYSCGDARYTNTMVYIDGDFYCSDCPQLCFECGDRLRDDSRCFNGERYCRFCVAYCADCGEAYCVSDGPECHCSDLVQIESYHHTTPSIWLGEPLPRNRKGKMDGYYLGIELEVTAHDTDFSNTVEWCESHIGAGALHIKEDCSVKGYELVFEPMTPQFFEAVNWRGFFLALDRDQYIRADNEPDTHGLHVHVGRVAFRGRTSRLAAFSGILGAANGTHMERVGRRDATPYCNVVPNPIRSAIVSKDAYSAQSVRIQRKGAPISPWGRGAINFNRSDTVEIRSPKSTRDADEFMETVRTVYLAADYVRAMEFLNPAAISWEAFTLWIQENHADKLGENMIYEFDEDEEV